MGTSPVWNFSNTEPNILNGQTLQNLSAIFIQCSKFRHTGHKIIDSSPQYILIPSAITWLQFYDFWNRSNRICSRNHKIVIMHQLQHFTITFYWLDRNQNICYFFSKAPGSEWHLPPIRLITCEADEQADMGWHDGGTGRIQYDTPTGNTNNGPKQMPQVIAQMRQTPW